MRTLIVSSVFLAALSQPVIAGTMAVTVTVDDGAAAQLVEHDKKTTGKVVTPQQAVQALVDRNLAVYAARAGAAQRQQACNALRAAAPNDPTTKAACP